MKISVVIATYRGAARVRRLLDSIEEHGQDLHEVLVVDDGSPAADLEALEDAVGAAGRHAAGMPFSLLALSRRGWIASMNDAVPRTSGDVVLLLDDDVLLPAGLPAVLEQLLALPNIGVLSWRSHGTNPGQSRVARPGMLQPATELAAYCMAFRRSLWDELGGLDPRYFIYCSDSDFCLRATLAGHPCYRVFWPLVPHEEHACMKACPELDRAAYVQRDLAAYQAKWGRSGAEMEQEALRRLADG